MKQLWTPLAVVVVTTLALGCIIETSPPDEPAPTRTAEMRPAPAIEPEPAEPIEVAVAEEPTTPGLEPGYEYCCGNDQFRLDIGCGYLDMRCYERTPTGWQRTYGRHCKKALGMACYLNGCDNRCD